MMPTLTQLRYFIATAETGQVTKAAAATNVTQSSVTIAINELERLLGYKLFTRTSRGMRLTSTGETYLRHANGIMAALQDSMNLPKPGEGDLEGTLHLGATSAMSAYLLPRIWTELSNRLPNVTMIAQEVNQDELKAENLIEHFDFALVLISNLPSLQEVRTKTLLRSNRSVWLAANHPLLEKEQLSLADLKDEKFLFLDFGGHERTLRNIWEIYGFDAEVRYRTNSFEALRNMVARGVGVAIVSDFFYRPWSLDGGRIISRSLLEDMPLIEPGIVWHKDRVMNDLNTAFLGLLSDLVAQD